MWWIDAHPYMACFAAFLLGVNVTAFAICVAAGHMMRKWERTDTEVVRSCPACDGDGWLSRSECVRCGGSGRAWPNGIPRNGNLPNAQ